MATRRRRSDPTGWVLLGVGTLVVVAFTLRQDGGVLDSTQIPGPALAAYVEAADRLPGLAPRCEGLDWSVLAGIGRVESHHARGSEVDADGDTDPWILGPRLDGSGAGGNTTAIPDTDGGRWDQDEEFDRAVGPMQFIPTSWELYGQDGNDDGEADPHNLRDAALAAAVHLCGSGPRDLSDPDELRSAVLRYNQSGDYADEVLGWARDYAGRYPDAGSAS